MGNEYMTSEKYILHMEKYKDFLKNGLMKSVIVPEGNLLLAETKNRVVVDGKSSTGNIIGHYSTKPGYYTKDQFVRKGSFKPTGKRESAVYGTITKRGTYKAPARKTEIINGRKVSVVKTDGFHAQVRTSMYLPGGYKEFRNIQGRSIDKVNMNLSGDTQNRYQMRVNGNKLIFGMTTQKAAKIREGNDKRFGVNIFASTKQQIADFNKRVSQGMEQGYNQSMND